MAKPLVFLDFDETLFHHYLFIEWFDDFAQKKFGVKPGTFAKELDSYHDVIDDTHRIYRHVDHFEQATGKSWSYVSAEVENACHLEGRDFCYDDAHETINWLVENDYKLRILTYGNGDYQRYKIKLCPVIRAHNLPVHVVSQPKRDFLKRNFADHKGILVDDKYPLGIDEPWQHIWIDRKTQACKHIDKVSRITSLLELTTILTAET